MHGSATTTPEIRREIRRSANSVRRLAEKYGIDPKTVAKWKSRPAPDDLPMGPGSTRPKSLSIEEEGTCIGFRIHTMLPLDDCHYALQLMMPQLSRAGLHRLYQRHGISRLADIPGQAGTQDRTGIGGFYIDAADIRTGDGLATMLFAFDRTSKFAYAKLYEVTDAATGATFLSALAAAAPYAVSSVLTGEHPFFGGPESSPNSPEHPFAAECRQNDIHHTILPFDQPWRIRREAPEIPATAPKVRRRFHYKSHTHLGSHFRVFLETYNFERRLKTLGGITPYEFICRAWQDNPAVFHSNPIMQRADIEL